MSNNGLYPPSLTHGQSLNSIATFEPQSRYSSSIELSSILPPVNIYAPPSADIPLYRPNVLHVAHRGLCPNFNCKLTLAHDYQDLTTLSPPEAGAPIIHLRRFTSGNNPFPERNLWEIVHRPEAPFQDGDHVYLAQYYGSVILRSISSTHDDWIVFECHQAGRIVTAITMPVHWTIVQSRNTGNYCSMSIFNWPSRRAWLIPCCTAASTDLDGQ